MFGSKNKNSPDELPDISPSAPSMRDYQRIQLPPIEPIQEEKGEIHGLPSFPDSPMNRGFSQSMIKSAIDEPSKENSEDLREWNASEQDLPSIPQRNPKAIEMDEWKPSPSFAMPRNEEMRSINNTQMDSKRPLFVKLEKFRDARESLTKIADKLDQMDELLKMIKEVKAKEDEELTAWERDVESIKARIAFVNKEIFENAY